ncbi:hypothetical protein [Streptomyces sp. NBC_00209]|uniref:hypothetical protein n=1 Tax=Streptomyces sp. NBC_00209 TaxID=2975682 RepID=UPI003254897F
MTRAAPYVIPWAGETILPMPLLSTRSDVFCDDARADRRHRDDDGVLWEVWGGHQTGPRVYTLFHPVHQREAMRALPCATCGRPADRKAAGMLWLLPLLDGPPAEGTTWEGVQTTIPPSCVPCADRVATGCPWMRDGHVRLRARIAEQVGVHGTLYSRAEQPGPDLDLTLPPRREGRSCVVARGHHAQPRPRGDHGAGPAQPQRFSHCGHHPPDNR